MGSYYESWVKTPSDKFSVEVKDARDPVNKEVVVKGYSTATLTLTQEQLKVLAAALSKDVPF